MKMTKMFLLIVILFLTVNIFAEDKITISPIKHATFVLTLADKTIYVDPVGSAEDFKKFAKPDIILITHTHRDHLNKEIIEAVKQEKTVVVLPQAAFDVTKFGDVISNGEKKTVLDINIEAVPMYNTTEERLKFHEKGVGNGYVLTANNRKIYIAGDTEDTKEMRSLKNIDYAIVCMNLPYTMTVEQAASAVLEMKPKTVIPYHYRGTEGFSDINKFKELVSENKNIEVKLLDWYAN